MTHKGKKNNTWLIVAHLFNIDGNAASQTITDRIPYLIDKGISPVVLSSPTGRRDRNFPHLQVLSAAPSGFLFELRHIINKQFKNEDLRKLLKTLLLIISLPFYIVEKIFVHLDSHWSWFISATARGYFIVRKYKPAIIYSTAGPSSTHLTGFLLSKICGLPWLVELHDPLIYDTGEKKWQFYYFKRWLEKKIATHASAVIYFTDQALQSARGRNTFRGTGYVLRPGAGPPYDLDTRYQKRARFHLGHFGTLAEDRNLNVAIKAIHELLHEQPELRGRIVLDVFGCSLDAVSRKCLQEFPLGDALYEHGRLEYDPVTGKDGRQRALEAMFQSDVLLLVHGEGVMCREYIPSKFYEYLLAGRPIIGLVEQGSELASLLVETGRESIPGNDVGLTREAIFHSFDLWRNQALPAYEKVSPYTIEKAVDKLVAIADSISVKTQVLEALPLGAQNRTLLIIRRSLGDVLATSPLVNILHESFPDGHIDLLVNDDTYAMAKAIKHVRHVYTFSYGWGKKGIRERVGQEFSLIRKIKGKYDLAISLTGNERSTIYALLAGKISIAAIDRNLEKSWWRNAFLDHTYMFDPGRHIVLSNLAAIEPLHVPVKKIELSASYSAAALQRVKGLLNKYGISSFLIFHPSARFEYKIYPRHLRDKLLKFLNGLGIPIVITGGNSEIDLQIAKDLPQLANVHDFIGKTTLEEAIVLTDLSMGYIGMDTFNMHIAAALNKKVISIFGPTLPQMWSPWSNTLQTYARESHPIQRYGNITLIQADKKCVACGLAGCDDKNSRSLCLDEIEPEVVFAEVKNLLSANGARLAAAG